MLPELAVSGYPPEDLLFHSGMRLQVARSLERLKQEVRGITLIAGYPEYAGGDDLQFSHRDSRRRRARQSSQGLPAELSGVRRKALFHAGHRSDHHRDQRHESGRIGVRGCLGCRSPRARRATPARRCCW